MTDQERKDLESLRDSLQKSLREIEERLVSDEDATTEEFEFLIKKARHYLNLIQKVTQALTNE